MRRIVVIPSVLVLLSMGGCPEPEPAGCSTYDEVFVWVDADEDGFGSEEPIGYVCDVKAGQATNNADCDDENAEANPQMDELCDLVDNDCNGLIDETHPKVPWYPDTDGDGYGALEEGEPACQPPGAAYTELAGDCDDGNPDVNPLAIEVCDEVDNDCDGKIDDEDPGVDPTTYSRWHPDDDGDGYGDRDEYIERCLPAGSYTLDGSDCDDTTTALSPDANEVCDDIDNDCDDLIDDFDPDIDPSTQNTYFADTDGDGYGDPNAMAPACDPTPGYGVDNSDDCDDTDPLANIVQNWYVDLDGDGAGVGNPVVSQCLNPGAGTAPEANGVDCDDADPNRAPHLEDICEDGIDQDCSGTDRLCISESCKLYLDADPSSPSGIYTINPGGVNYDVYCDMTTDGGGWTLVGSTAQNTPDDAAGTWHNNLTTLSPSARYERVWNGMRSVTGVISDIRFTCKTNPTAPSMAVDLSFYANDWYDTITTGTESQSCFNDNNGLGAGIPPQRRNNINGATRAQGDQWNAGYLEGEDTCSDSGDFTVDFDDRGMDSNQTDGTDWGEDDSSKKCGTTYPANGAWFIFVREL